MNYIDVYTKTTTNHGYKRDLMLAFANGVNIVSHKNYRARINENYTIDNGQYVMCFNYQRQNNKDKPGLKLRKDLIDRYEPTGKIFYYDSNVLVSYEKEKHDPIRSYVRIAYSNVFPNKAKYFNKNPKSYKWDAMRDKCGIQLKDYDKKGDKIYICCNRGSGGYSGHGVNAAHWAIETATELRKYTDRPIVVRTHKGIGYPSAQEDIKRLYEAKLTIKNFDVHSPRNNFPDLIQEIRRSYAVIIFTSSAGAPAVIEGKPLFVTHPSSYLYSMSAGQLSDIENPNLDLNRDKFLWGLGESHWTLQDIESGLYFKKFLENVNDD